MSPPHAPWLAGPSVPVRLAYNDELGAGESDRAPYPDQCNA